MPTIKQEIMSFFRGGKYLNRCAELVDTCEGKAFEIIEHFEYFYNADWSEICEVANDWIEKEEAKDDPHHIGIQLAHSICVMAKRRDGVES